MFLNEVDLLVRQEQHKDLQRKAARERLIRSAGLRQPKNTKWSWKIAAWMGAQMVKWGSKLQRYTADPSTNLELLDTQDAATSHTC